MGWAIGVPIGIWVTLQNLDRLAKVLDLPLLLALSKRPSSVTLSMPSLSQTQTNKRAEQAIAVPLSDWAILPVSSGIKMLMNKTMPATQWKMHSGHLRPHLKEIGMERFCLFQQRIEVQGGQLYPCLLQNLLLQNKDGSHIGRSLYCSWDEEIYIFVSC